ncbi:hypothetical protein B566_EDAN012060, partial [Ephemera danica]
PPDIGGFSFHNVHLTNCTFNAGLNPQNQHRCQAAPTQIIPEAPAARVELLQPAPAAPVHDPLPFVPHVHAQQLPPAYGPPENLPAQAAAPHDQIIQVEENLERLEIARPRRGRVGGNNPPQLQIQGDAEANEHPAGVVAAIGQEDEYADDECEMFPTVKQVAVIISNLPLTLSFEHQTRLVMKIQEKALDRRGDSQLVDFLFVKNNDNNEIHLTVKNLLAAFKLCEYFNHLSSRDFPAMELKANYEVRIYKFLR